MGTNKKLCGGRSSRVFGDLALDLLEENSLVCRVPRVRPPPVVRNTEEHLVAVGEYLRRLRVQYITVVQSNKNVPSNKKSRQHKTASPRVCNQSKKERVIEHNVGCCLPAACYLSIPCHAVCNRRMYHRTKSIVVNTKTTLGAVCLPRAIYTWYKPIPAAIEVHRHTTPPRNWGQN